jgi:DedD protein
VDSSRGAAAAPQPPASRASAPALAASQARQPAAAAPRPAASAPKPATPAADAHAKQEEQARAKREQEARAKREADARAARARALLEGRATPASAPASRFVVQVGAFATADKARQARQQAERAGVKTYVQVVNTTDGQRTRVRAGPYTSQAEANKALAALKKAGLSGSVLAL